MWPTLAHGVRKAPERRRADFLWPLLLAGVLLLLALELFLAFRTGVSLYPIAARGGAGGARSGASEPGDFQNHQRLDVVLGVDLSRSVGQEGREKAREILERPAAYKKPRRARGSDVWPLAGMGICPATKLPGGFRLRLDREETDIRRRCKPRLRKWARIVRVEFFCSPTAMKSR